MAEQEEKFDSIINSHFDRMDIIRNDSKNDIEKIFDKLNIKKLLRNPDQELNKLTNAVLTNTVSKYSKPSVEESKRYVKNVSIKDKKTG